MKYGPVMCGAEECIYENHCLAQGAGYDWSGCEDAGLVTFPDIADAFGEDADLGDEDMWCPQADPDAICHLVYSPVVCGPDACLYENDCQAEAAGFGFEECEDAGLVTFPPGTDAPSEEYDCHINICAHYRYYAVVNSIRYYVERNRVP